MEFLNKKLKKKILIPLIITASFAGGFFVHDLINIRYGFDVLKPPPTEFVNVEEGKPIGLDFSHFWDVWNVVSEKHVDKEGFDLIKMRNGAINGMLEAIGDPFTNYLPPQESKRFFEDIGGEFSGIGIEIGIRDEILTVIAPLADTPAAKAGILAGDKIIKIDDKLTTDMNLNEAVELIRGQRGSKVVLMINRNGDMLEFSITRDKIKISAVKWKMIDNEIAYVQIITFNGNVIAEYENAAREIIKNNARKIILDLRNNPGGLLDAALNISSWFLNANDIVTIEDFGDGQQNQFSAFENGQLKDRKVVILINQGSASASEILAGALKDNNKSPLIGTTTFGKGSVQEVEHFSDNSSLKYTVARWLTPLGSSIDKTGLKPDFEIELTKEDIENSRDPQLDKAVEIIKGL